MPRNLQTDNFVDQPLKPAPSNIRQPINTIATFAGRSRADPVVVQN